MTIGQRRVLLCLCIRSLLGTQMAHNSQSQHIFMRILWDFNAKCKFRFDPVNILNNRPTTVSMANAWRRHGVSSSWHSSLANGFRRGKQRWRPPFSSSRTNRDLWESLACSHCAEYLLRMRTDNVQLRFVVFQYP